MRLFIISVIFIVLIISWTTMVNAEEMIDWRYIETQHFNIIYHPEVEKQAYHVAQVAEEVYFDLAKFTGFKPYRKIAVILSAYHDFGNGAAIPRDLIFIWINPLLLSTRVDGKWLENLITHELTHIVQTEATFGTTYWIHKLTGASSVLGLPPNAYQPLWFLEGAAQYGSYKQGYDSIDRKREMIFEHKIHSENFYTNSELIWARSSIGGETLYNFGFGFFEFLMSKYGEERFLEIQMMQNNMYYTGLDTIMRMVYGKRLKELIEEWKEDLRKRFPVRLNREIANPLFPKPDLTELSEPLITPEGGIIFVESHIERPSIKINYWHPNKGITTLLDSPKLALTRLSLSSDGKTLLYTAYDYVNTYVQWDLYKMDLDTRNITRLSENCRILQGVKFKNGYLVVKNDWGKFRLYYLENGKTTRLTDTDYNFVISDLAISPDEKRLAINFNYNGKRGIGIMQIDSWEYEKIYYPPEGVDWLLGDFTNNQSITVSWDRLNHYDLYRLDISSDTLTRVTNTKEDILQGQLKISNNREYWYGQIYGSSGFTISHGLTKDLETITLSPQKLSFTDAASSDITPEKAGKYHHLEQLRSDMFVPFFGGEEEFEMGISQYMSDPLQELGISYDLSWNLDQEELVLNLNTVWRGTNPGFDLTIQTSGWSILAKIAESYEFYPYFLSTSQFFHLKDGLHFDQFGVQLGRSWVTKSPGTTILGLNYYPDNGIDGFGYDIIFQHNQNFSLGYHGDSIFSETTLGYAGGKTSFSWGKSGLLWVYPEKHQSQGMAFQRTNYRHNLLDLSASFSNVLQTGRLYTNFFFEAGLFLENNKINLAEMAGIGLELETQILNTLGLTHQVSAAINSHGDKKVIYSLISPF